MNGVDVGNDGSSDDDDDDDGGSDSSGGNGDNLNTQYLKRGDDV